MHRRRLIATGLSLAGSAALAAAARAQDGPIAAPQYGPQGGVQQGGPPPGPPPSDGGLDGSPSAPPPAPPQAEGMPPPNHGSAYQPDTYSEDELVRNVSDFFGVTAEQAGSVIARLFRDNGRPTGYIAGEEGAGAIVAGLRYGKGLLYMKHQEQQKVYWQGPSIGWDFGGNASRVFTLCYNLQYPDMIFRRFPGVEGTAYFIAGLGVNYQRAEDITLAPVRTGVGFRLGANLGYLDYSRQRNILPL